MLLPCLARICGSAAPTRRAITRHTGHLKLHPAAEEMGRCGPGVDTVGVERAGHVRGRHRLAGAARQETSPAAGAGNGDLPCARRALLAGIRCVARRATPARRLFLQKGLPPRSRLCCGVAPGSPAHVVDVLGHWGVAPATCRVCVNCALGGRARALCASLTLVAVHCGGSRVGLMVGAQTS